MHKGTQRCGEGRLARSVCGVEFCADAARTHTGIRDRRLTFQRRLEAEWGSLQADEVRATLLTHTQCMLSCSVLAQDPHDDTQTKRRSWHPDANHAPKPKVGPPAACACPCADMCRPSADLRLSQGYKPSPGSSQARPRRPRSPYPTAHCAVSARNECRFGRRSRRLVCQVHVLRMTGRAGTCVRNAANRLTAVTLRGFGEFSCPRSFSHYLISHHTLMSK